MAILRTLLQELLKVVSANDMSMVPDFSELKPEARFAVLLYHRWQVTFHMCCMHTLHLINHFIVATTTTIL